MNEEILEYLRGQFGDDYMSLQTEQELRDYENGVFRRGILDGYSMIDMQPAMDQLRTEFVKKRNQYRSKRGTTKWWKRLDIHHRKTLHTLEV